MGGGRGGGGGGGGAYCSIDIDYCKKVVYKSTCQILQYSDETLYG